MYNKMNGVEIPIDSQREVIITQENSLQISQDIVDSCMLVSAIVIGIFAIMKFLDRFIDRKQKPLETAINGVSRVAENNSNNLKELAEEFKSTHEAQQYTLTGIHKEVGEINGFLKGAFDKSGK